MNPPAAPQHDAQFRPLGAARWRPDKVTSLAEALKSVRDGYMVALGGMTLYRRPVAAVAELIRQGRRDLTLLDYTAGFEGDILIGADRVSRVHSCYFGLDVLGPAPMYRRAVQSGRVAIVEETEATIAYGLRAARARVDFLPARILDQTDLTQVRPDLVKVRSPYSDRSYIAVPPLVPGVAVVHAWLADPSGNAVLRSNYCLDADLAAAARVTIITAEKIAPAVELEGHQADVLGGWVDHVVEVSGGAYPTSCFPDYDLDLAFLADYIEACAAGDFDLFLSEHVL